ncbi:MAG: hypothetical protein JWO62_2321 [Acidimicrobiaceae bacterium]|jgi:hypothetical protein|nr:hypothetical protein [Acidimicrobiaceae bacterium]
MLIENCGTFLHASVPEHRQKLVGHSSQLFDPDGAIRDSYDARAKTYRWSQLQSLEGGEKKFRCPLYARGERRMRI